MSRTDPWSTNAIPDLAGRRVIVTGGNSGIGLETARHLSRAGADVLITSRSTLKGATARDALLADAPRGAVEVARLDLADLSSVRDFAASVIDGRGVDVLINNAGIMGVPHDLSVDGFELQLGTNHLGHFALTGLLVGQLLEATRARVVTLTSLTHRYAKMNFDDLMGEQKYRRGGAYSQSKLANLLFTMELQRRFRRIGSDALSLASHPGIAATNNTNAMLSGLPDGVVGTIGQIYGKAAQSAADGAMPSVRAACDPTARGGDCYGPSGRGQLRGPAVVVKPKTSAFDVHDARALWERSIELTGVDFAELVPEVSGT